MLSSACLSVTFGPPSPAVVVGCKMGERVQRWLFDDENQDKATKFADELAASLQICFNEWLTSRPRKERECGELFIR